ncbi:NYN domain-containing protein [Candidatus Kaiserbacteria bacterium]|nr:NYN domain-containing protein [Candidatus Kaiserbacteria bacterium]
MKTYVYIDGFNLFYGALKKSPYKWLDISKLCAYLLQGHQIETIKYFTAPMKIRDGEDHDKSNRQQIYLRALRTLPNVEIVEGFFLTHKVTMKRADGRGFVDVIKTEEKGTDVKLAAHLLHDGHRDEYEMAAVISNDADLAEPIRMVVEDLKRPVVVISPFKKNTLALAKVASSRRKIRKGVLSISQFPDELADEIGTFKKPEAWS